MFAGACAFAVALLAFGYYLQYGRGVEPCPLCIVQRWFFIGIAVVALVASLHGAGRFGTRAYAALVLLLGAGGAATAGRQVWLQHLPPDRVPECGPGIEYMLEFYPLPRVLDMLFKGSGECAEVAWSFLRLSIAEWALLWFVAAIVLAAVLIVRPASDERSSVSEVK
jgi:disulfide bond formation protein DsbB